MRVVLTQLLLLATAVVAAVTQQHSQDRFLRSTTTTTTAVDAVAVDVSGDLSTRRLEDAQEEAAADEEEQGQEEGEDAAEEGGEAEEEEEGGYSHYDANGNYVSYEDFDAYMKDQMSYKSFYYTGCSTKSANSNGGKALTYVTFRFCDYGSSCPCGNANGDFVVTLQEFTEVYSEYVQADRERTYNYYQYNNGADQEQNEDAPYECMRVQEYVETYSNGYNPNYSNYQQQQQQQGGGEEQQYQGSNGQYYSYDELYIGPLCAKNGRDLTLGLFTDEECSVLLPKTTLSIVEILGVEPDTSNMQPSKCVACSYNHKYLYKYNTNDGDGGNNNNNNADEDNIALCSKELLEEAGRCDPDGAYNERDGFDSFWQEILNYVKEEAEGDGQEDQQQQQGNGNMNQYYSTFFDSYYKYQNQNTCSFIETLAPPLGFFARLRKSAEESDLTAGDYIFTTLIFLSIILACVLVSYVIYIIGYCCSSDPPHWNGHEADTEGLEYWKLRDRSPGNSPPTSYKSSKSSQSPPISLASIGKISDADLGTGIGDNDNSTIIIQDDDDDDVNKPASKNSLGSEKALL